MVIKKRFSMPKLHWTPRTYALIGFVLMLIAIPITVLYLRLAGPQPTVQRAANFAPVDGKNFYITANENTPCPDGQVNKVGSYGGYFSVRNKFSTSQTVNVIIHKFFCTSGNVTNCTQKDIQQVLGPVTFSGGETKPFTATNVDPGAYFPQYSGVTCGTYQIDLEFVGFNSYTYQSAFWCDTHIDCAVPPTATPTPTSPPPPTVTPTPTIPADTPTPTPTPPVDTPTPTPIVPSDTPTPTITPGGPTLTPTATPTITPTPGSVLCTSSKPGSAPDLYQIDTTQTTATLYFVPAQSPVTDHRVSYGTTTDANTTTALVGTGASTGALKYVVSGLTACTRYYFKVQGLNGCTNGDWSKTVGALTQGCTGSITPAPTLPSTGAGPLVVPVGFMGIGALLIGGLLLLAL